MDWWHVLTTPGTELVKEGAANTALDFLNELSCPAATVIGIVLLYYTMLGSKRANRWLYWLTATYFIFEMVVSSL